MALKRSSETITISGTQNNSTGTLVVEEQDLMLNALDQEVFVVLAVQIDFNGTPIMPLFTGGVGSATRVTGTSAVALSTTRPSALLNIGDPNCFSFANQRATLTVDANDDFTSYFLHEQSSDVPDTNLDYIAIIATSNFFVATQQFNAGGTPLDISYRIWGYRARADAATYAALVQSEVLSS